MCIAIHKPAGKLLPTMEQFENCFSNNGDGAGLAYPNKKDQISFIKGLMTIEQFKQKLTQIEKNTGGPGSLTDVPMLFHFRIGTHGATRAATHTHPFPIKESYEELTALTGSTDTVMIHNGILSTFVGTGTNARFSDTQNFIRFMLEPLSKMGKHWPRSKATKALIDTWIGSSKIAIMHGTGSVERFGEWTEDGGVYYSNTTYKYTYYSTAKYGDYLNDDAYTYGGGYYNKATTTPTTTKYVTESQATPDYVDSIEAKLPIDWNDMLEKTTYGKGTTYYDMFEHMYPNEWCSMALDEMLKPTSNAYFASDWFGVGKDIAVNRVIVVHNHSRHIWAGELTALEDGSVFKWKYVGKMWGRICATSNSTALRKQKQLKQVTDKTNNVKGDKE